MSHVTTPEQLVDLNRILRDIPTCDIEALHAAAKHDPLMLRALLYVELNNRPHV